MPTVVSGQETGGPQVGPYCSLADFLKRYDNRSVGDRLKDDGTRVIATNLTGDPNLAALLNQAQGMFETAVVKGNRYSPNDLIAVMQATPPVVAADMIRGLISDLTWWLLTNRRPDPTRPVPKQCELALATLDFLANGYKVFAIQEKMDAGMKLPVLGPNGPVTKPFEPVTSKASRMFPLPNV